MSTLYCLIQSGAIHDPTLNRACSLIDTATNLTSKSHLANCLYLGNTAVRETLLSQCLLSLLATHHDEDRVSLRELSLATKLTRRLFTKIGKLE